MPAHEKGYLLGTSQKQTQSFTTRHFRRVFFYAFTAIGNIRSAGEGFGCFDQGERVILFCDEVFAKGIF